MTSGDVTATSVADPTRDWGVHTVQRILHSYHHRVLHAEARGRDYNCALMAHAAGGGCPVARWAWTTVHLSPTFSNAHRVLDNIDVVDRAHAGTRASARSDTRHTKGESTGAQQTLALCAYGRSNALLPTLQNVQTDSTPPPPQLLDPPVRWDRVIRRFHSHFR